MQGMNNKIHFLVSRVIAYSVIRRNPNYKTLFVFLALQPIVVVFSQPGSGL